MIISLVAYQRHHGKPVRAIFFKSSRWWPTTCIIDKSQFLLECYCCCSKKIFESDHKQKQTPRIKHGWQFNPLHQKKILMLHRSRCARFHRLVAHSPMNRRAAAWLRFRSIGTHASKMKLRVLLQSTLGVFYSPPGQGLPWSFGLFGCSSTITTAAVLHRGGSILFLHFFFRSHHAAACMRTSLWRRRNLLTK